MMSFQRIGLTALALCAVFTVSLAQDGHPPGDGPGGPGQRRQPMMQANWKELTAKLHLTDDQAGKLKAAVKSHMEGMKALRESDQTDDQKHATAKANQEAFKSSIKIILSSDQFKTLEEIGGPRRLMGGPPSPMEMLSSLGLSDEQKGKVKAIFEEERKAADVLRTDESVSPEDRREKMQAIYKQGMEKLKAVLTEEQFGKLQKMMQQGPGGLRPGQGGPPSGGPGGGGQF